MYAAAAAKSLQSCPILCDPIEGSPPGFPVPGILQARTLEWVAISFSSAWKWKVKVKSLSRVWLLATPWTAAYQAPPSLGFSRKEYWSGVPLPSPANFLSFCLMSFCCPRTPTLHLLIMPCLFGLLLAVAVCRLSLLWRTLTVLRNAGQVLYRIFLSWDLCEVFPMVILGLWIF